MGENLHDLITGNDFLSMTPKAQATKEKIDKLNLIKMKNFFASKDTIKREKSQPTEWEKIRANHIGDKGLTSGIYKELLQFKDNPPTLNIPNSKK